VEGDGAVTGVPPTAGALATVDTGDASAYPAPQPATVETPEPNATPDGYPAQPRATATPDPYASGGAADGTQLEGAMDGLAADSPQVEAMLSAIAAELAESQGIDPATVTLVSLEPTTWSDGSLGCPAPDMMYTQALVDGYLIIVESGGETFEYHTSSMTSFVRCENGSPAGNGFVPETN
jgi:hypothetical protein